MNLIAIISNIGLPDVLDILFISVISYQLYIWFRGSKAFKALVGIIALSGVFLFAQACGLFLTTWVFQILWQVFVILLIILFQREIRQMLERFNPLKTLGYKKGHLAEGWIDGFATWAFDAAKKRLGVLIIFERGELVFDLITKGIAIESDPLPEILNSIFYKESPLHDGAALISHGKVLKASCFLPLTTKDDLPPEWGTRHRAALGLTEQSDACVMIISEERGDISFALGNEIHKVADKEEFVKWINDVALASVKKEKIPLKERMVSWVTRRYPLKLAVFASVFIFWIFVAGQQNYEKKMELPLNFKNIPAELTISRPVDPKVTITCRGLRKDVSLLGRHNVDVLMDLFSARAGTHLYPVTKASLSLPNDRIHVVNVSPAKVELTFEKKLSEQKLPDSSIKDTVLPQRTQK